MVVNRVNVELGTENSAKFELIAWLTIRDICHKRLGWLDRYTDHRL